MSGAETGLGFVRLLRVVVALGVVSVLAYVGLRVWARLRRGSEPARPELLQPLAKLHVGGNNHVVLVQVAERRVLLGVAPARVDLLLDLGRSPSHAEEPLTSPSAGRTAAQPQVAASVARDPEA